MTLPNPLNWVRKAKKVSRKSVRARPSLQRLEGREVPAGYMAIGAGTGSMPWVAIRVDIRDALGGVGPTNLAEDQPQRSDGKTDFTSQLFLAYNPAFRGGVHTATGNFDGLFNTPDSLVTAPAVGSPHIIVWNMQEASNGAITVGGIRASFFAFDPRFVGGVNITTGDLDGDGRAELITAAGPGGGPHVRIWKEIQGQFRLVNEFFAFDPSFRGGVSVASGQGYKTFVQQRLVLTNQLPADFRLPPVANPPGTADGIPQVGLDYFIPPGGQEVFGPNGGYVVPNGVQGHFDAAGLPRPYITVASGQTQYLSANLFNEYGNLIYRPNKFFAPGQANPDGIGDIVFAMWDDTTPNLPAGFERNILYGPFVRINATDISLMTSPPGNPGDPGLKYINHLVVGAGPGGGPHVKVYQFGATTNGVMQNLGVGREFFAFDATFTGGVNVAINDVIAHPGANRIPGRFDQTQNPSPFIVDTDANSGTQTFTAYPVQTRIYETLQPEVMVGMASQGSEVRVFSDLAPIVIDPANPRSDPAPARRTNLNQLNLQTFGIDAVLGVDPRNPINGYYGFRVANALTRTIDSAAFTGGVNVAVASFQFKGSMQTDFYGFNPFAGGTRIATNPVLGKGVFGAGPTPFGQANRGAKVRMFNQLGPYLPTTQQYAPIDEFQAFTNDPFVRGAFVAFGFGTLPEPGLDVIYANYNTGANGTITPTVADPVPIVPYDPPEVMNPRLLM